MVEILLSLLFVDRGRLLHFVAARSCSRTHDRLPVCDLYRNYVDFAVSFQLHSAVALSRGEGTNRN